MGGEIDFRDDRELNNNNRNYTENSIDNGDENIQQKP